MAAGLRLAGKGGLAWLAAGGKLVRQKKAEYLRGEGVLLSRQVLTILKSISMSVMYVL